MFISSSTIVEVPMLCHLFWLNTLTQGLQNIVLSCRKLGARYGLKTVYKQIKVIFK